MRRQCKVFNTLITLLLVCTVKGTVTAQTMTLDLRTSVETALTNNNALRADSLHMIIQEYKKRELAGWLVPQVNLSSRTNYNREIATQMLPGSVVGQPSKDFVPVQFGTKYEMGSGVEVHQTIFRKDLFVQVKGSELQKEIARTRYSISKEDLAYQVAKAYYGIQSTSEMIRTTSADCNNLNDILRITKGQYESGVAKRIDFETLEITVANKQSSLNQLITQYNEQLQYFKYFLGIPASQQISVNEQLSFLPELTTNQALNFAARQDIRLYGQLGDMKQVELQSKRAEKLPVVSGYLKHNYQSQFNKTNKVFDNDYWFESSSLGVTVTVPLFDGNRRKHQINAIQTEIEQLRLQADRQKELAATEVITAEQTLRNNRIQFEVNTRNLKLAEKVFNSRKALYTEGVSTLVELLDAEKELSQARNLHVQALISVQTGQLSVLKASGNLLQEILKPR